MFTKLRVQKCCLIMAISIQSVFGQNLKRIQTFYDVYQQQIKEDYTVLNSPPYLMHGLYRMWDKEKVIVQEVNYANGKKNGLSKAYYHYLIAKKDKVGKLWQLINYKNDVFDGVSIEYDYLKSGQQIKLKESTYKNGEIAKDVTYFLSGKVQASIVFNGACVTYFDNGKIESKYTNVDGEKQGKYYSYFDNGKLDLIAKYKAGALVDTAIGYFDNGKVSLFQYVDPNSLILQVYKTYFPSGKLKFERVKVDENLFDIVEYDSLGGYVAAKYSEMIDFRDQEQPFIRTGGFSSFFASGKPLTKAMYEHGKLDGSYTFQDDLGNILNEGKFDKGRKVGEWRLSYNKDWEIIDDPFTAVYYRLVTFDEEGKIEGSVRNFYLTGEKQFEGVLSKIDPDVMNGEVAYYYKNGQVASQGIIYRRDTSEIRNYTEEGILTLEFNSSGTKRCIKKYWESGKPKEYGCLTRERYDDPQWLKEGIWQVFNQKGEAVKTTKYEYGQSVSGE